MADPAWNDNIQRSCAVLYFHFFWGLCMVILGWTAFAARWIARIKPYHRKMGQIWVYGMIVQIYSSTYASYNGFRWFIFMFGIICYGGLIIGHTFIRKFQRNREAKRKSSLVEYAAQQMQAIQKDDNDEEAADNKTINMTNPISNPSGLGKIEDTFWTQQNLKKFHGIFMFISLVMVTGAGAAFTSRFASTAECKNIYCDGDSHGDIPYCYIG